nr:MAG: hypothetical protein [Molluscum contagiosum virus]
MQAHGTQHVDGVALSRQARERAGIERHERRDALEVRKGVGVRRHDAEQHIGVQHLYDGSAVRVQEGHHVAVDIGGGQQQRRDVCRAHGALVEVQQHGVGHERVHVRAKRTAHVCGQRAAADAAQHAHCREAQCVPRREHGRVEVRERERAHGREGLAVPDEVHRGGHAPRAPFLSVFVDPFGDRSSRQTPAGQPPACSVFKSRCLLTYFRRATGVASISELSNRNGRRKAKAYAAQSAKAR